MKFIDTQLRSECQLVAVINAAIKLKINAPRIGSVEYHRLIALTKAQHGSCLCVDKAIDYFGMTVKRHVFSFTKLITLVGLNVPVGLSVHDDQYGYHAVCVVGMEELQNPIHFRFAIPNWNSSAVGGWIEGDDLATKLKGGDTFGSVNYESGIGLYAFEVQQ